MKIEDQVVSLELSRRLYQLGFKQKSYFVWHGVELVHYDNPDDFAGAMWPAYTVAELGEMLPYKLVEGNSNYYLYVDKWQEKNWWRVNYGDPDMGFFIDDETWIHTEADARARVLIYLKETKLLS